MFEERENQENITKLKENLPELLSKTDDIIDLLLKQVESYRKLKDAYVDKVLKSYTWKGPKNNGMFLNKETVRIYGTHELMMIERECDKSPVSNCVIPRAYQKNQWTICLCCDKKISKQPYAGWITVHEKLQIDVTKGDEGQHLSYEDKVKTWRERNNE